MSGKSLLHLHNRRGTTPQRVKVTAQGRCADAQAEIICLMGVATTREYSQRRLHRRARNHLGGRAVFAVLIAIGFAGGIVRQPLMSMGGLA